MKRLRNFGWLSAEDVNRIVLSFAVMVLIARHLGPANYGALSYIFGVVGLLAPLTVIGLDVITVRRLVVEPEERDRILGSAFLIRFCGAILAAVVAVGLVACISGPKGVTLKLTVIAALTLPFLSAETFNGYFKATERMAWMAIPRIFARWAIAAVTLWLVLNGGGLFGFVAVRVAGSFLLAAVALAAYRAASKARPALGIDTGLLSSMLREGAPLFISSLAVVVYMRIDQIMLGQLATADALGQYSVAVRVSESIFFVPIAIQAAFYPGLVKAAAGFPKNWQENLQHYFDIVALVMLGLAIAMALAASVILPWLLGAAYGPSVPMIWVLALGAPFVGLGVARTTFLTIQQWLWTAPLATIIGAFANVLLNFLLIPAWGGIGAAFATVISYWLAGHGTSLILPWLRPIGYSLTRALDPIGAARRIIARRRG